MKSLNLLLAGLLVVGFTSCGGGHQEEAATDSVATDTVVPAPVADTAAPVADSAAVDSTKK